MFLTPPLQSRTPLIHKYTYSKLESPNKMCILYGVLFCHSTPVLQYSRIFVMVELSVKYLNDT